MAKLSKTNKPADGDFALLQGGTLEESVVQRQFAEVKRRWLAELDEENAIRQEAGKSIAQIETSADGVGSTNDEAAISKLRKISDKLTARKLPSAAKLGELPGVWGNYTLKFTPPYTGLGTSVSGQISSVTGN